MYVRGGDARHEALSVKVGSRGSGAEIDRARSSQHAGGILQFPSAPSILVYHRLASSRFEVPPRPPYRTRCSASGGW